MNKRLLIVTLSALIVLAAAGTASAAPVLSMKTAHTLAKRLALLQVKRRHVIAYQLSHERRVSSRQIDFRYADRSPTHVYCTGVIAVRAARSHVRATFTQSSCRAIPADALAAEAAALGAARAVAGRRPAVRSSLAFYRRTLSSCHSVRVPKAEALDVARLVQVGTLEALEDPVSSQVSALVRQLGTIQTSDTTLARAIAAWIDYDRVARGLPRLANTCTAVRHWAANGWKAGSAPVDFGLLVGQTNRLTLDRAAIIKGADKLLAEGVLTKAALAFTPTGLLAQLQPKRLVLGRG